MRRASLRHASTPVFVLRAAVALLASLLPVAAFASDGALEINQTCVATGCVPGDTAGFPVSTEVGRKYVLTSDLTLASANTDGVVLAEGATLDLNGFAITGPYTCSGTPIACSGSGNGFAIMAFSRSTVRDGSVRGMLVGVNLQGRGQLIENVSVEHNGSSGVNGSGEGAIIRGCRVARNEQGGILALERARRADQRQHRHVQRTHRHRVSPATAGSSSATRSYRTPAAASA